MLRLIPCALSATLITAGLAAAAEKASVKPPAPIAVVELFTSAACPSCPAADAFLGELANSARRSGQQVYPLSFHVDYWSAPGSEDPLSSPQFVARQHTYVEAMRLDGAYTPQMIVNGTQEFIGSQRDTGKAKIKSALAKAAPVGVKVSPPVSYRGGSQPIAVEYEISSAPANSVVNVAFVEKHRSGERDHAGKTREYVNVVRVFRTVPLRNAGKDKLQLTPPSNAVPSNCAIVVYVQNSRTHAVLGAAATDLAATPTGQVLNQPRE